jgi:hypothetical protein
MNDISKEFEDRFQDKLLFNEQMTCSIEDQHVRYQMELAEIQNDPYFIRCKENMHEEFWILEIDYSYKFWFKNAFYDRKYNVHTFVKEDSQI